MKLIIVESPTKAKTIKGFLPKDYEVIASKGHIIDLPKTTLGINIKDDKFIPEYKALKDHENVIKDIKAKASKASCVYLATDEDREGEAIAYHIATLLNKDIFSIPRIVFHEITKEAILKALKNPRKLNISSINAQQARRLLDRIVGYKLSPLLSSKIQNGLSAGRVQSAALKLIVDKELEIKAFVPLTYYTIDANLKDFKATLIEYEGQKLAKYSLTNKDRATLIYENILKEDYKVFDIQNKELSISPPPPFMTSTLQALASSKLGYSPKKTMMLAQKLYEGVKTPQGIMGVITYMRTDSLNIAKEALSSAREYIQNNFGEAYLPPKALVYTTKTKGAQEAHEAIRPTNLAFDAKVAKEYLDNDEFKLYNLIFTRFIASQMNKAKSSNQNIFIKGNKALFELNGKKIIFDGFYKIYNDSDKDIILPNLKIKDEIKFDQINLNTCQTKPPARYSEAGLIKKLEALGIGRPSTYAPTLAILSSKEYINIEKSQLIPNEIAFKMIEVLDKHFNNIVDAGFSSILEDKLDQVASDELDYQVLLSDFYYPFIRQIELGKKEIKSQKTFKIIEEKCPNCGGDLAIRNGKYGEFISCLSFPRCRYIRSIPKPNKEKKEIQNDSFITCPKCSNGKIVKRKSKKGIFYGCSSYPKCDFISSYELSELKCCDNHQIIKRLKSGTYIQCLKCKNKTKIDEEN